MYLKPGEQVTLETLLYGLLLLSGNDAALAVADTAPEMWKLCRLDEPESCRTGDGGHPLC
jgi:hypothetical protein